MIRQDSMLRDRTGNAVTTSVGAARDAYVDGCDLVLAVQPGAEAALRRAVAQDGGGAGWRWRRMAGSWRRGGVDRV